MVSAESGSFTTLTTRLWCQSLCQPWWPCPFQKELCECLLWPFADATPFRDWWIDCRAAASVSVPWAKASRLRVGIPAMASALGLLLWPSCRGPWGLVAPGAALTHILLSHPWRHSSALLYVDLRLAQTKWLSVECSSSTGKLPDCAKPLLMAAVRKGQERKLTEIHVRPICLTCSFHVHLHHYMFSC